MQERAVAVAMFAMIVSLGCRGTGTGLDANGDPLGPGTPADSTVLLSRDVQPILTASCAVSGCHAGASPAAGLNLSDGRSHANTVDRQARQLSAYVIIRPFEPDSSYLIFKVEGTSGAVGGLDTQMPLGGNALPAAQIDLLRRWILAGAPDN